MSKKRRPANEAKKVGAPSAPVNFFSWVVLAVLIVMLLWSCRAFFDYGDLGSRLSGKTMVERGYLGSDEWHNFLARAGRARTQALYAEARRRGIPEQQRSRVAAGWAWIVETEKELAPDATIYLNFASSLHYYYGSTIWYPRRLDVNTERRSIRDEETLERNAQPMDASQVGTLRALGYTHIVTAAPQGARLIDLRRMLDLVGGATP